MVEQLEEVRLVVRMRQVIHRIPIDPRTERSPPRHLVIVQTPVAAQVEHIGDVERRPPTQLAERCLAVAREEELAPDFAGDVPVLDAVLRAPPAEDPGCSKFRAVSFSVIRRTSGIMLPEWSGERGEEIISMKASAWSSSSTPCMKMPNWTWNAR